MGTFIATVLGLCGVVYLTYPDQPAVPRTFPGGLEEELGGKGAVRVSHILIITDSVLTLYRH